MATDNITPATGWTFHTAGGGGASVSGSRWLWTFTALGPEDHDFLIDLPVQRTFSQASLICSGSVDNNPAVTVNLRVGYLYSDDTFAFGSAQNIPQGNGFNLSAGESGSKTVKSLLVRARYASGPAVPEGVALGVDQFTLTYSDRFKFWDGSQWRGGVVKTFRDDEWKPARVRLWNGSEWA